MVQSGIIVAHKSFPDLFVWKDGMMSIEVEFCKHSNHRDVVTHSPIWARFRWKFARFPIDIEKGVKSNHCGIVLISWYHALRPSLSHFCQILMYWFLFHFHQFLVNRFDLRFPNSISIIFWCTRNSPSITPFFLCTGVSLSPSLAFFSLRHFFLHRNCRGHPDLHFTISPFLPFPNVQKCFIFTPFSFIISWCTEFDHFLDGPHLGAA